MLHLGLDISKDEIVGYADSTKKHYTIANTEEAVKTFLQTQQFDIGSTLIGCESTGDYHIIACVTALQLGYRVQLLNPILTGKAIDATIRKIKTDRSDAELIAKLLAEGEGTPLTHSHFQRRTRTLLRTEQSLVRTTSKLKLMRQSILRKSHTMDLTIVIKALEKCIALLGSESQQLTEAATQTQDRQTQILDSIPGCGPKLAAIISAEAGDIKRFKNARELKAYVGIDPRVKQSGHSSYLGKMTKRGPSLLRSALFQTAQVAYRHDPALKEFYLKKRQEHKSHRHVLCIIIRKLCERIYAIVSKNCSYKINYSPS
jgi:transposase